MNSKNTFGKEPNYGRLLGFIVLLIVTWGIVPAFGKLANMPGDVTTFYVNVTALIALALIITIMRYKDQNGVARTYWTKLKNYSFKDYGLMVAIGVVWPLIYSLFYFQAIYEGEPVGMTILNYTWPLMVIALSILKYGKKAYYVTKSGAKFIIPVILTVAAVVFYQMDAIVSFTTRILVMGLIAALTQALFNFIDHGYDNWIALFVIEATTVVFIVPIMIFTTHYTMVPSLNSLLLMSIIGVAGNAIGFWVFMEGRRECGRLKERGVMTSEPIWLAAQGVVPISVLVTMIITNLVSKNEQPFAITTNQIISLVVLAAGLVLFFIFKNIEDHKIHTQ
ncbi:MAG TPA: DMT family transporter [Patescibacteria group bacterium]|nr:DMT family transporter [bacterium]HRY56600.1 DMT family transporter [Patescibacteria group bacterium]